MTASVVATLLVASAALAEDPSSMRVRVRGSAVLKATARVDGDAFTLRGALVDDAGLAIPHAELTLQLTTSDASTRPILTPLQACVHAPRSSVGATPGSILTEADGAFCVRGRTQSGARGLRVRFDGTPFHDAVSVDTTLETMEDRSSRTMLRFEPAVDVVDLDRELALFTGWLHVDRRDASVIEGADLKREALRLFMEDERGTKLGEALTAGDGRARFEVPTSDLAPPGPGEVRLRFDGAPGLLPATTAQAIVRRAAVSLALVRDAMTSSPEDGVEIEVLVTSARGIVSGGVVEALAGGVSAGAGSVVKGKARVVATIRATRAEHLPLVLRYVPAAPWWHAGPDLAIQVAVLPPNPLRPAILAVLVIALGAWILSGWRRAPKTSKTALEAPKFPMGEAGVKVVEALAETYVWRGLVRDAHDGTPIAGATLQIIAPAFHGDGVVARAVADDGGVFALEAPHLTGTKRADCRLVVDAPEHTRFERALPAPSRLDVALITRRRALIERLIHWARRQGAPFDNMSSEPTPGHIRRAAARAHASGIETWATQTEQAVFGPSIVDEHVERTIRAAEPNPPAGERPLT